MSASDAVGPPDAVTAGHAAGWAPLHGDPGVQVQRTVLAWQRTALSTAAAGLVAAAGWVRLGEVGVAVPVALVALVAAAWVLRRRHDVGTAWPPLAACAAVTVVLAVVGVGAAVVAVAV